ncbi:hypothetical protein [Shewanella canadensis]|uniref:hypothetical protein n=1 Tax=Shewanella canadensis TaxID=271096 RepID=UPI00163B50A1|nr:hypothetical protein [Shewanella canadensis]
MVFRLELISDGNTSILVRCEVRNKVTHLSMVCMNVDEKGMPQAHGKRASAA